MLLRLPAGTDPFATLHAAELLDEIIGGGIEGTLHRDSFDGLVADFGPDPTQERPEVKPATDHPDHAWPRERGNVWMLENRDGVLRYLSDRWNGRVIGFRGAQRQNTGPDAARDARDHRHRRRLRPAPPPR